VYKGLYQFIYCFFKQSKEKEEEEDAKKGKKKGPETVGAQFKGQLAALMSTLSATCPHFVRCVKPNTLKQASNFDREIVLAQLRYAGTESERKMDNNLHVGGNFYI
jgi:myosin heavy subunit